MKQDIEGDLALLQSTRRHAPAGPSEEEVEAILEKQRKVRKELQHARVV
jgi:hypothetical protein